MMQLGIVSLRRAAGASLCGLLAALAVSGCGNNPPPATPPTSTTTTVNTAPPAATTTTTGAGGTTMTTTTPGNPDTKINTNAGPGASNGTDTATADAVNTAIVHNKQMTGSRVEVVVTGGVARLNGTVQDQQQKALAGTTAGKTPGVNSVINKLEIVATGGAHAKPAKPKTIVKIFKHTTVIHDNQPAPGASGNPGGTPDNSGNGAGTNSPTAPNGNANGGNGAGTPPTPPTAPTTSGSTP